MTFLLVFAVLVFCYGLVSARVERVATAPIAFTLIGGLAPVLLSILLHGFTAQPGITWYARQVRAFPAGAPELQE